MAAPRTKPTRIGETLRDYLGWAGLGRLAVSSDIAKRWAELMGSGIASHSSPQELKGGRLTVIVDSSAWMNQLALMSNDIIAKLNKGMGEGTVSELKFRIGKPAPAPGGARKQAPKPLPRRKLEPGELAEIERAAAAIPDPELRASAKKLMAAAASARKKA